MSFIVQLRTHSMWLYIEFLIFKSLCVAAIWCHLFSKLSKVESNAMSSIQPNICNEVKWDYLRWFFIIFILFLFEVQPMALFLFVIICLFVYVSSINKVYNIALDSFIIDKTTAAIHFLSYFKRKRNGTKRKIVEAKKKKKGIWNSKVFYMPSVCLVSHRVHYTHVS